jgi:hypothetical protein
MQFKCSCGKMLKIPDAMAGKKGKCPGCAKVFTAPASATAQSADKITFQCYCGSTLAVPASGAGKRIRCPSCKEAVHVPERSAPQPTPEPTPTPEPDIPLASAPAPEPAPAQPAPADVAMPSFDGDLAFEFEDDGPASTPPPPSAPEPEPVAPEPDGGSFGVAEPEPIAAAPEADDDGYGVKADTCPVCSEELEPGSGFCVHCGTNLSTGEQVGQAALHSGGKSGPSLAERIPLKPILIGVGSLVGLGLLWVLYAQVIGPMLNKEKGTEVAVAVKDDGDKVANDGGKADASKTDATKTDGTEATPNEKADIDDVKATTERPKDEWWLSKMVFRPTSVRDKQMKGAVDQSVTYYKTIDNSKLPKSLKVAKAEYDFPDPPKGVVYVYDPATGRVELGKTQTVKDWQSAGKWDKKLDIYFGKNN